MRSATRPDFSHTEAEQLALESFGVVGSATALVSHADQNFRVRSEGGESFVLKIARAGEERAALEMQEGLLERLGRAVAGRVPRLVAARDGSRCVAAPDASGRAHWARLMTWLPGTTLARVRPHSPALLADLGALLGQVDLTLAALEFEAAERESPWNLEGATTTIAKRLGAIADPERRALVEGVLARVGERPHRAGLRRSVLHNDANDHNLLVDDRPGAQRVSGLIDFGDAMRSWTLAEVAIACTYAMLDKRDPLAAAGHLVRGYHGAYAIPEHELAFLLDLVLLRLGTSVAMSADAARAEPDAEYLRISEAPAWRLLEELAHCPGGLAHAVFREACGLEPCARTTALVEWMAREGSGAANVLGIDSGAADLRTEPVAEIDLSIGSPLLDRLGPDPASTAWERELDTLRAAVGARVVVGAYDEARACYAGDLFDEPTEDVDEKRTVHLGIDLFVAAGSSVHAPLDATVAGVQDNAGALDYGPTVLLRHEPEPGLVFHTLYGHLARASVADLRPGTALARGTAFARIGEAHENGGWAPHLHFQCIADLLDREGEFPGVAAPSRRALWRSLCPDPRPLLGLAGGSRAGSTTGSRLRERRERTLGPSLSLSYRRPLTILRGRGSRLFDAEGRQFLDAVNNVPHVGHAHPRVVRAAAQQMSLLNTNTRYLHPKIVEYAERLAAHFDDPLEVVYLVCSGSEANELALRLARATTGSKETIVQAAGYHGNTTTLVGLSHYKFAGRGGFAPPPHVHVVPLPDPYRGLHRGEGAAERYVEEVRSVAARLASPTAGKRATFLAEALPGCGGQIVPPDGYLRRAFEAVRETGGVCIADEVQTGFARVGCHDWAFGAQGAVPDIVTLGKPIGNGHPLGAVVTTRAIAERFDNGMEYFNTFGGNPVSCAVGLEVLDVIRDERLRDNARNTGALLLARLRELGERHTWIGDVRGLGLYLGVELVRDRTSLEPAAEEAAYVAERLRDKGVLVSTDGPDHNVLKIKPPLVFSEDDAERLARALDDVLGESSLSRRSG